MERFLKRTEQIYINIDSESSDSKENSCGSSQPKRKYTQKLRKSWFSDPRLCKWIVALNEQKIKCKYCQCILQSRLSTLLTHAKSSRHFEAAAPFRKNNQRPITFQPLNNNSKNSLNPDLTKPTCRVCLQNNKKTKMFSIFDLDEEFDDLHIYEKIEQCAGIEVLRHEKMPSLICVNCYGGLKASYTFRTTCRISDDYLKEYVLGETAILKVETTSPKHNPLSISENTPKKETKRSKYKTKLRDRPSPFQQIIKDEKESPAISPINSEELNDEYFGDDDDADKDVWFDIDYKDDDDDISCGENIEELELEIKEEKAEAKQSKKQTKTKKKYSRKSKKSQKTLDISPDGEAIIQEKKPRAKKEKKEKKEKQPHICDVCGNIYQRRYDLITHMKRHSSEKPYKCELCKYSCYSSFELIRHMRKHTGARPYKCSYCPRDFGDQSTLIKHERLHRNERPFKCDTCGKSFTYSNVLKYHILVHTGEKPYCCEICGKLFNSPHHLRAHLRTLQHQNDPRTESLIKNIRKNNETENLKVDSVLQSV